MRDAEKRQLIKLKKFILQCIIITQNKKNTAALTLIIYFILLSPGQPINSILAAEDGLLTPYTSLFLRLFEGYRAHKEGYRDQL